MRISVVGTGYVGLVAGACLADGGNHVVCVDNDASKIEKLKAGIIPIYEPGLQEIVHRNAKAGRLQFTTDLKDAVENCLLIFLGVGTPPAPDGSADMSAIHGVVDTIAECMNGYRIIVMKSTVPVGTHRELSARIAARTEHKFDYVSNPEFLKEGAAIEDFMRPDRVVIGASNPAVAEIMREVYAPFMRTRERIIVMDPASAELTKYAANALLAAKISFMNEISGLCDRLGADVEKVRAGVGSDARLGPAFLFAGIGYGGSCFPKDVSALAAMGAKADYPMTITEAVQEVNLRQRRRFAEGIIAYLGDRAAQSTLAVWGLAFKARTDDVRESPAIDCIKAFLARGIKVQAFDPEAMDTTRAILGDKITYAADGYAALVGADALVVCTDWQEFRTPDFDAIAKALRRPVIFDGRNLYERSTLAKHGFEYHCIGRPDAQHIKRRRTDRS
jgi:UDPglucose 6-dehydrogenase